MEENGQIHVQAALPRVKDPQVPIGKEVEWAVEPDWELLRGEKCLAPAGIESRPSIPSPGLYRLRYPGLLTLYNQLRKSPLTTWLLLSSYRTLRGLATSAKMTVT
jgi:hypothetical protein